MRGRKRKSPPQADTAPSPKRKRKSESPPQADTASSPKRTRVGDSNLIINGDLKHFRSASMAFSKLVQREGQAYFDRTRYISKLHELDTSILFCRPRRFGKSLTVSMLEHFHGLQYAGEHQSLYKVCNNTLNYLDLRTYMSFNYSRVSMCKKISTKEKQALDGTSSWNSIFPKSIPTQTLRRLMRDSLISWILPSKRSTKHTLHIWAETILVYVKKLTVKSPKLVLKSVSSQFNMRLSKTSDLLILKGSTCSLTSTILFLITTSNHLRPPEDPRSLGRIQQLDELSNLSGPQ